MRGFLTVAARLTVAFTVLALMTPSAARAQVPATGASLTTTLPSPQLVGTPVAFTAAGVGSTNYQYQFFYQAPNDPNFTLAQDWSPAATWTMPAALAPGTYLVVVHVRTGTTGFDAQAWTLFTLDPPPATGVTVTAVQPSPQVVGTPVVFTAAGTGASGYQYQFFYQAPGSAAFTLAQDWSPSASWTMPTTFAAGDYLVVVHVRTGSVGFDAQAWTSFTLAPPPATGVTLVAGQPSPQRVGTPVAFTATGSGSSGYQYQFWYQAPGSGNFVLAQDWSAAATWTMPANLAAGTYLVVVHVRTGTVGFDAQDWTSYTLDPLPAPTIAAVTPASGTALGGDVVTISGANFAPGATVSIGGTPATVGAVSAASISVVTPAALAGTVGVTVTNPDGQAATLPAAFTFVAPPPPPTAPAPSITLLTPSTGTAAGGDTIVIAGANFVPGLSVTIGNFPAAVVSVAPASITITTGPGLAGVANVVVVNPDNQSATLVGGFTYTAPAAKPPRIASITPITGPQTGGTQVTINGSDFAANPIVTFGGTAATVIAAKITQLIVTAPAHAAGLVDVTVTNPDGQLSTAAGAFTYTAVPTSAPPPAITSIVPSSGDIAGGTAVAIGGSNFIVGATVTFGGVAGTVLSSTGTSLVVNTPAHAAGFVDVSVINPDGQTATIAGGFRFIAPGPVITALNVKGAPAAGGTTLLLSGTGLVSGASVTFGGIASPSVTYDAVNKVLNATVPPFPLPAGQKEAFVTIVLTNPDGQTTSFPNFHYGPPPVGTDFFVVADGTKTLRNGKAGQLIDIVGNEFSVSRGVQVLFSGPGAGFGTVSTAVSTLTKLEVGIPKLNPGTYVIIVTNFDGQFTTVPGTLTVLGP